MKDNKIAVLGALSVDICPTFTGTFNTGHAHDFSHVIKPGAITHIEGNEIHPGGPVANTGIALSFFGIEPVMCAKIGDDEMGKMLLSIIGSELKGAHQAPGSISIDNTAPTAYSIILAPPGIDRAILQNPGANDTFSFDDINWDEVKNCKLLHFGHPSTMANMYKDDGEELLRILKTASKLGLVTSLDLCAIDPSSDAGKADWEKILGSVLPYTDFFLPSIDDLNNVFPNLFEYSSDTIIDATSRCDSKIELARKLAELSHRLGAGTVLIKLGEDGMYYSNGDASFFSEVESKLGFKPGSMSDPDGWDWAGREGHLPAMKVEKVVSGLGAGDVTIAAYLAAMVRGFSFDDTIEKARNAGAQCVTDASATGGLSEW